MPSLESLLMNPETQRDVQKAMRRTLGCKAHSRCGTFADEKSDRGVDPVEDTSRTDRPVDKDTLMQSGRRSLLGLSRSLPTCID
jgi:hypothetical protein